MASSSAAAFADLTFFFCCFFWEQVVLDKKQVTVYGLQSGDGAWLPLAIFWGVIQGEDCFVVLPLDQ